MLPDGPDVRVRAEVADPGALAAPDHRRPRPLVVDGQGQPRVALVVLQPDVEAGLELLDQVVLEEQGLGLGAHHHPLDVVGLAATIWAVRGARPAGSWK